MGRQYSEVTQLEALSFCFLCLVNQKALRVYGNHANCEIPGQYFGKHDF